MINRFNNSFTKEELKQCLNEMSYQRLEKAFIDYHNGDKSQGVRCYVENPNFKGIPAKEVTQIQLMNLILS